MSPVNLIGLFCVVHERLQPLKVYLNRKKCESNIIIGCLDDNLFSEG